MIKVASSQRRAPAVHAFIEEVSLGLGRGQRSSSFLNIALFRGLSLPLRGLLSQIIHRLLDHFIHLVSNLIHFVFPVQISSYYFICLHETIELPLQLSVLPLEQVRVLVQGVQFPLKLLVSV